MDTYDIKPVECNNIEELLSHFNNYELVKEYKYNKVLDKMEAINWVNLAMSYDIETSSYYAQVNGLQVKRSVVCTHQFGIFSLEDKCVYTVLVRTWEDWDNCYNKICEHFKLSHKKRIKVYIHNLGYESQWLFRKYDLVEMFARDTRSPLYGTTKEGVQFICSYYLSACSLEQVGKDLLKYKSSKQVEKWDYDLLRSPKTPLSQDEKDYALYDVVVVCCFIQESIENNENKITKIPLTKTGYVRRYVREKCLNGSGSNRYKTLMNLLRIRDVEEYEMLKKNFSGGFTHASWLHSGKTLYNVGSFDFTSSYPTVMISEKYPLTPFEDYKLDTVEDLEKKKENNCLIFKVCFEDLEPKFDYEHYFSASKCDIEEYNDNRPWLDNGRVIRAKKLYTIINEVEWDIVKEVYSWSKITFGYCMISKKGYLPKEIIESTLDFYEDKTKLKDVKGMENEYQLKKGMLNGIFGMMVMDIINDEISFDNDLGWLKSKCNTEGLKFEEIEMYNKNKKRFTYYAWGVYITSYAKRNLWSGILEFKEDFIYADTDSLKVLNYEKHLDYINKYNDEILYKLYMCCAEYNIDFNRIKPKTIKGKEKPLGVWDFETKGFCDKDKNEINMYSTFKCLGAKRYLYEYYSWDKNEETEELEFNRHITCTIAGVNKKDTSAYIASKDAPFDFFDNLMEVPEDKSGRMIVFYIDEEFDVDITDYQGIKYNGKEIAGVHMEKSDYNLSMSPTYLMLLNTREEQVI